MELKKENLLIGALGSTLTDLFIDIPLSYAGLLKAVEIRDAEGNYVWGYGSGDGIVDGIGAGLALYGLFKDKSDCKEIGFTWLLTHGMIKLSELYGYIKKIAKITVTKTGAGLTLRKVSGQIRKPRFH